MAHANRPYQQAGYDYSPSDPPQLFRTEDAGWGDQAWSALYGDTPSVEPENSSARRDFYAPMFPTIHIDNSSQELYMPAGVHAVQSTPLRRPENWAPPSILHPDPMPFNLSPPFVSATTNSTVQPVTPNGPPASTNLSDYAWVPQRQYALTAHHFTPAHPILFNVDFGEPGIRLSAALSRRFTHLGDRDDLVFGSSKSPTITMRLEWPGHMSWSRQVRILDSRSVRQSISREKLAYEVAKTVLAFAQSQNGRRPSAEGATDRDRGWIIGEGGLGLDDLVLVRVENVSKGSWQPQFLVRKQRRN